MPYCDVDLIAQKLIEWGNLAHSMPPSWDGALINHPICGPEGQLIGKMLPGKGLYLEHDFKTLGITKGYKIPHVYEKTVVRDLAEKFSRMRHDILHGKLFIDPEVLLFDERGAITTYDGIIAARAAGHAEDRVFSKISYTTVANVWSSIWQTSGFPASGTYSATPGINPNNTTTGALSFGLSTPGTGAKYLLTFGFTASQQINMLLLHDQLCQVGNLSATVNTNQAIASSALTRYTTGAGVLMTFDVTTAIGTTASNLTITYNSIDSGGSTHIGQTTPAIAMTTSMIAQRLLPAALGPFMQLASGDIGVTEVTNIKLSAAMSAGVFALNLYYPLMFIPGIVANIYIERDSTIQIDGLCNLPIGSDSAIGCLNAYVMTNTTSTGVFTGFMRTCSG